MPNLLILPKLVRLNIKIHINSSNKFKNIKLLLPEVVEADVPLWRTNGRPRKVDFYSAARLLYP